MHTCLSEQNWKNYRVSYSGARRKWLMHRMVPQGELFNWKEFEEITFVAKMLLTQWRGSLSRMWHYAMEGSNGEDDIDMEGSI